MKRLTKEQINELPLYLGLELESIYIVESELDAENALHALKKEACLGFDTESKPIFRQGEVSPGPTLIQLATDTEAFLFPTRFSAALAAVKVILSDPAIKKMGFGLKGDRKELRAKLAIDLVNTVDLSIGLKRLVADKNTIGARAAVAMVLKSRLSKGAQKSNWGAYPLKKQQILYAANDAYVAIAIKNRLAEQSVCITEI